MNAFISKYSKNSKKSGFKSNYNDINSTKKWVELSLDIHEMNKILLTTKNFNEKMDLLICLELVQKKREWMVRHPNFDSKRARFLFDTVKNS
jgi:hypothetical protein